MARRGLSFDEKRLRLKQLFLETKGVFTLKEIVKLASKEKGIVAQSVEEVLKSLVDDGEVQTDKIGTSNYFWCFPSQELVLRRNKAEALRRELATQQARFDELTREHADLVRTRPQGSESRAKLLAELHELRDAHARLADELAQWAENDPELVAALGRDARRARDAANRWTDNVFMIRQHCEARFGMAQSDFNQSFDVPADLDYVS